MSYCHFYTLNRTNMIIVGVIIKPGSSFLQHLILLSSYSSWNLSLAALMSVLCCKCQLQHHQCCHNAYRRVTAVATIWVLIPASHGIQNISKFGPLYHDVPFWDRFFTIWAKKYILVVFLYRKINIQRGRLLKENRDFLFLDGILFAYIFSDF